MAAPKKPDYPALRRRIEKLPKADVKPLIELHERALWLEGQQLASKPVAVSVITTGDGKGFKGSDFKKGKS